MGKQKEILKDSPARYVGYEEAEAYCGISKWTIMKYVQSGQIPSIRLPHAFKPGQELRRILIDLRDVDAFMEKNKVSNSLKVQCDEGKQ